VDTSPDSLALKLKQQGLIESKTSEEAPEAQACFQQVIREEQQARINVAGVLPLAVTPCAGA
jgi:hypothetical protein